MSSSGTISVAKRGDIIHEFRNLLDSALRAERHGQSYGPINLTIGTVKVTVAVEKDIAPAAA